MKTNNLEWKRAFMCEGGYPVVHPLDSHPKGCNVAAIEGRNVELFGTNNHGETWELEGYWVWDDRFNEHFIIWLDKMVEFVESQLASSAGSPALYAKRECRVVHNSRKVGGQEL